MAIIQIELQGVDNASGVFRGAASALGGLGDMVGGVVTHAFGNLLSGAITGATAAMGDFVRGAMDAEKITAQTEAVIKSTGGAAGLTATQIGEMATALSKNSTYADDAIQQGENLLLTFTNIGKDVFPKASKAMVDMAAAMGTDVSGGAIQLGKALNDPVAGISALSRVGVTFTDDQKKVIEQMVKTGDVAGAQQVILAELNKEFGGSAAAQADTFGGRIENLKNQFDNMGEGIIGAVLPGLTTLMDKVITPLLPQVEAFAAAVGNTAANFLAAQEPVAFVTAILSTLQTGMQPIIDAALNLGAAFSESMPMIQTYVNDMVTFVQGLIAQFAPTITANVTDALNAMATLWRAHGDEIMAVVNDAFRIIAATIGETLTLVSGLVSATLELMNGDFSGAAATMTTTWTSFISGVLSITGTNLADFTAAWSGAWSNAGIILGVAWAAIQTGVASAFATVLLTVNTAIANLQAAFNIDWGAIGTGILTGIATGISSGLDGIKNAAVAAAKAALDAAKDFLGIRSPSAAFAEIGNQMMAGMSMGIAGGSANVARNSQAAAAVALQATAGTVYNRAMTFNISNYGGSAEENTARLRAMAGAF